MGHHQQYTYCAVTAFIFDMCSSRLCELKNLSVSGRYFVEIFVFFYYCRNRNLSVEDTIQFGSAGGLLGISMEFAFATLNLYDLQFGGFLITCYYSFVILFYLFSHIAFC